MVAIAPGLSAALQDRYRLDRGRAAAGRRRFAVITSTGTSTTHILGISAFYHDSAAVLLRDGAP
jgi:hypothetical protein